tara:strand:+ start:90 stop:458 length:369 start_codon:yes stop_codon:yes gene_type:complete
MDTEINHENNLTDNADKKDDQEENTPAKKTKRKATQKQLDSPLHGVKLAYILESLVEFYGWKYLANEVNIQCFIHNPSVKVSLKFLRKMDWAREHIEDLYIAMLEEETYHKMQANKKTDNKA